MTNLLEQLSEMTVVVADTGDLEAIAGSRQRCHHQSPRFCGGTDLGFRASSMRL